MTTKIYSSLESLGAAAANILRTSTYAKEDEKIALWNQVCVIEYLMNIHQNIADDFGPVEADLKTLNAINTYAFNQEKLDFANSVLEFNARPYYPMQELDVVASCKIFSDILSSIYNPS